MKTKKKKKKRVKSPKLPEIEIGTSDDRIFEQLSLMKHRDMQKACILRGMPFEDVVKLDHDRLIGWLYKNWDNTESPTALVEYDIWLDTQLAARGHGINSPLRNPAFNFSIKEPDFESNATPAPRINNGNMPKSSLSNSSLPNKPAKTKREKNPDWGIQTGTKKFLTYELTIEDKMDLPTVIKKVRESYPIAEEKSIKIWFGRAKKFLK